LLWRQGPFYQAATLAQYAFYSCAILAILLNGSRLGRMKIFTIPYFFCMVYAASLVATYNILRGYRIERWEPQRQEDEENRVERNLTMSTPPGQGER
jgi:hypothetical protein